MKYYGAIEGGGTKFVCSIAADPDHYEQETRFPTTNPEETIQQAIDFFAKWQDKYQIQSIGIASFGPIDLNKNSKTYGYITTTPKPHWGNADFVGPIQRALGVKVAFDTDVNAAALGEYTWGNPKGVKSLVYYTIGTGVGGGVVINGEPVHGLLHPEAGHVQLVQDFEKDPYKGHCPYHGNCLEGLCCGPAIQERFGLSAGKLGADHPFWPIFANYIAQACVQQILILSPEKIVLGGGVMHQMHLFPMIRSEIQRLLNGYIHQPMILEHIDEYITPPVLGDRAGACGAIAMAIRAEK